MNIKETFLYKDILSKNLGSEFNANLEWELERAYINYDQVGFDLFDYDLDLYSAFNWVLTPQGHGFWEQVATGELPKEYQ